MKFFPLGIVLAVGLAIASAQDDGLEPSLEELYRAREAAWELEKRKHEPESSELSKRSESDEELLQMVDETYEKLMKRKAEESLVAAAEAIDGEEESSVAEQIPEEEEIEELDARARAPPASAYGNGWQGARPKMEDMVAAAELMLAQEPAEEQITEQEEEDIEELDARGKGKGYQGKHPGLPIGPMNKGDKKKNMARRLRKQCKNFDYDSAKTENEKLANAVKAVCDIVNADKTGKKGAKKEPAGMVTEEEIMEAAELMLSLDDEEDVNAM